MQPCGVGPLAAVLGVMPLMPAAAQSPAPEFAVKSILEESLARKFADRCDGLAFDHAGHDRHIRKRLGDFSNRGVHSRNIFKNFAPVQPHRYTRHIAAFNARHGLSETSLMDDFCAAAQREMQGRTPLGQMLKPGKAAGE